jgi:hypothetical protein
MLNRHLQNLEIGSSSSYSKEVDSTLAARALGVIYFFFSLRRPRGPRRDMGIIVVGDDHYAIGKAKKAPVCINHDAFVPEEGRPWKLFSRHAGESDKAMEQRIKNKISALQEVCAPSNLRFLSSF